MQSHHRNNKTKKVNPSDYCNNTHIANNDMDNEYPASITDLPHCSGNNNVGGENLYDTSNPNRGNTAADSASTQYANQQQDAQDTGRRRRAHSARRPTSARRPHQSPHWGTGNAHQLPREDPQEHYQPPPEDSNPRCRERSSAPEWEVGRNRIDHIKETWNYKLCIGNATINLKQ